jgi:hypothetical protein
MYKSIKNIVFAEKTMFLRSVTSQNISYQPNKPYQRSKKMLYITRSLPPRKFTAFTKKKDPIQKSKEMY